MHVALIQRTDIELIQLLGDDIKYLHKKNVFEKIDAKFAVNPLRTVTFKIPSYNG